MFDIETDVIIAELRSNGLKVLIVLDYQKIPIDRYRINTVFT